MIEKINLKEVPETMLWTLYNRAMESMRKDGIIQDEKAQEIYKSIDYDFEETFGKAEPSHAVRSLDFDTQIQSFLKKYPKGTIVNLGEGLETQRFRIQEYNALWISIDLFEGMQVRERFIKPDERHLHLAMSATDRQWFDWVPKDEPVFITAQGLFMYFKEDEVKSLIRDITKSFNHGYLMFDTVAKWMSKISLSQKGWAKTKNYIVPKAPWGIDKDQLKRWIDKDIKVVDIGYSLFPRGVIRYFMTIFSKIPILRNKMATIVKIEF